jgi:hypothetical protein
MRPRQGREVQVIARGIVLALLLTHPFAYAQEPVWSESTSNQSLTASPQPDVANTAAPASATQPSGGQLPDSPGTVQSRPNQRQAMAASSAPADPIKASDAEPISSQQSGSTNAPAAQAQAPAPQSAEPDGSSQNNTQPLAQRQQQQQGPQEPRGTAAAESVPTTGVAASRPAGAAVAPAKQRRVRSILIKVGVLVGAGVAVGTTMALSQGSPSKPPGSH